MTISLHQTQHPKHCSNVEDLDAVHRDYSVTSTPPDDEPSLVPVGLYLPVQARRRVKLKHRHPARCFGLFRWESIQEQSQDDPAQRHFKQELIVVNIPLSSTRLNFQYSWVMGTPSYALNVTHVIEESSNLGDEVTDLFRERKCLGELRKMLSDRKLSLYSVWKQHDDGRCTNPFYVSGSRRPALTSQVLT